MAQIVKQIFKFWISNPYIHPKNKNSTMIVNLYPKVYSFSKIEVQNTFYFYHNLLLQNLPDKSSNFITEDQIQPLFIRNSIENRITSQQYQANYKIEDRISISQLNQINGFLLSVFDGHGGYELAEFASKYLSDKIDRNIKKNMIKAKSLSHCIQISIIQGFAAIQNEYIDIARKQIEKGNKKIKNVGSCALCALVLDNYVYVANAGDSKAIIVSQTQDLVQFVKLNKKLNTSNRDQRERLIKQFSNEVDILKPHPKNNQIYYLKGRLQPTRTLGDYYLKLPEFNFGPKIQNFNGPYLSYKPDIQKYRLKQSNKYLILGSDGLWDELNEFEIIRIVLNPENTNKCQAILKNALRKIGKKYGFDQQQLQYLPEGTRRAYHDDISIIVVDLTNQYVQQK